MQNSLLSTEIKDSSVQFQLIKLSPEQISERWEVLRAAIESALPPPAPYSDPNIMNNILASLLRGVLECWILYEGEKAIIVGTFEVVLDVPSGIKSLLIYSLFSYKPFSYDLWGILLTRLRKYAKEIDCHKIVGYSNIERILELVQALGGSTDFRYIQLEV